MMAKTPQNLDVLMKKARVDPIFRAHLVEDGPGAAGELGIDLTDSERSILESIKPSALSAMIDATFVPRHHVQTFLGKNVAAMMALLLATAVAATAEGQTEGITAEELDRNEHAEETVAAMDLLREVLEAFKADHGRYPTQAEWQAQDGPLNLYLERTRLFDPWGRLYDYRTVSGGGYPDGYLLQSLGPSSVNSQDNLSFQHSGPERDAWNLGPLLRIRGLYEGEFLITQAMLTTRPWAVILSRVPEDRELIWYVDGVVVTTSRGGFGLEMPPEWLSPGRHEIIVTDGRGYGSAIDYEVESEDG